LLTNSCSSSAYVAEGPEIRALCLEAFGAQHNATTDHDWFRVPNATSSSTLEFLALAVLVSLFASELAEPPPPFAMDNEAQLSTAVVTAPHDTLLPKTLDGCEGFLEAELGVLGAAIVPPVFSPPALHVADAQEYWGAWLHGRLKSSLQWTDLTRAAVLSSSWQAIRCHGFARDTRSAFGWHFIAASVVPVGRARTTGTMDFGRKSHLSRARSSCIARTT
jgi:hypothetical protein